MASQSRKFRDTSRMGGNRMGTPAERLAKRVKVTEAGCHEYTGSRIRSGYGVMVIEGKQTYAHRIALALKLGRPLAPGELACHSCDNPPCCNPEHLFAGSIADNNRDMWAKGRGRLTPPAWRKIPLEDLASVIARFKAGEPKASIAETYSVSRQAIHYLLRREGVA